MSYGNGNTTVEKYFAMEFPYLLAREQRERGLKCGEFASYLGISVESLEDYRNDGAIPRSDTLWKIISKCSPEFIADLLLTAGIQAQYSITSNQNKPSSDTPTVEKVGI